MDSNGAGIWSLVQGVTVGFGLANGLTVVDGGSVVPVLGFLILGGYFGV